MRASSRVAFVIASLLGASLAGCGSNNAKPGTGGASSSSASTGGASAGVTGPLGDKLPVDATLGLTGLDGPVDVVRDKYGRPHIYATTVTDAMRVEGYLVAADRHAELDFYRRVSEGRLSELFASLSPSIIDLDITYRHIGLARAAAAEYAALPAGPVKDALDAYADGVSQAFTKIRTAQIALPDALFGYEKSAFTTWTSVDSLTVARFESYELSYDADTDLANTLFFSAARATFTAGDADPAIAKRAGLERDLFLFAPGDRRRPPPIRWCRA